MNTIELLLASLVASFGTVGLKGFQHKNVIGNHKRLVFVTSYLMACGDYVCINIAVKGGWIMALSAGTGAAFGMILAMYLHDRFLPPK